MADELKTKHIIFGLLLFIGGGCLVYQEYRKDKSWTPPPSENKTVVVYGKVPRTDRRSACIEVVDINNKHERFTICSEYCVQRMRGAYEGHYSSEVNWAERGDTLIVKSQGMGTWQIIKNVTAERLVNHSR